MAKTTNTNSLNRRFGSLSQFNAGQGASDHQSFGDNRKMWARCKVKERRIFKRKDKNESLKRESEL